MAQYTKAVSITFNDNDGGLSHSFNPESKADVLRHYQKYGKWRARLMFLKSFWRALKRLEQLPIE